MKRFLVFILLFSILAVGCQNANDSSTKETTNTFGELTMQDITVAYQDSVELQPTFSSESYEVSYSFEGNNIEIRYGKVKGLVADSVTTVTATTAHHSVTFTVTVLPDFGTLTIPEVYAPVNYLSMPITASFSDPTYTEALSFSFDTSALKINASDMTVKALKTGKHKVTASSEHFRCEFTVNAYEVKWDSAYYNLDRYNTSVTNLTRHWATNANANETVAFIGDSYFNENGFFSHFNTFYGDKDAVCLGIGYSGSYTWEIITENIFGRKAPGAIVIHIGTNNVYNDKDDYDTGVASLQRYFVQLHELYPEAPIYWFNITQRDYADDGERMTTVSRINATMKEWCSHFDWITCVETSHLITADMLADKVHVKQEHYNIFVDALKETDIVMNDK